MGLFDAIVRSLVNLVCGSQQDHTPEPPTHDVHVPPSVPHKPQTQPAYHARPAESHASPPISHPLPVHHDHSPSPPRERIDANQVNQQNAFYTDLRTRANEEGDAMSKSFEESHQAYARGDGALAKELSNKGKAHKAEMEKLHREASEWIFTQNNTDSKPGEVDLHGLYVKEAVSFTERSIQEAQRRGDTELHLIVGKGLHSRNGAAKIKPAIEELMSNLIAELDPQNAGVLIVSLDGRDRNTGMTVNPDDIVRGVERPDDGCLIM
ncbi:hypothetical protein EW026_g2341 [Hermanssonia centrifuga]|uniref:Smr domain-containing protein n=1 Tax=Hermanssonia centrifuga TaxID=98765 RepID=A0A4V6S105_9APHY|nr:hypothetical protein EW026_g2341 [Hermanssonia centrifuga]